MRVAFAAAVAAGVCPTAALAAPAVVARDVPLGKARSLAQASSPRFDLVGLHWQGPGSVRFRTRSVGGGWTTWRPAAPEADDLPDGGSGRWHLGNPYWTGASDGIQYRLRGRVTRLRAYFVTSSAYAVPLRRLSVADSPPIVSRRAWGADESIRRAAPEYAQAVRLAIVHHTAGTNGYTRAQSAAIVRGIERYHVLGNGWNDIGYNFLVDRYGQVFEGRYGGVDRNVVGAHAQGFNTGSTGIAVIGNYGSSGISAAARTAVEQLIAWRLDVAHVDPLSTVAFTSAGNPRFVAGTSVFLRAVSGHRDTGFTTCPGAALYRQLGTLARAAADTGLPKLYAPAVHGQPGQPVRFTATLSTPLDWTVSVLDGVGAVVASGTGTGTAVDWTWDATAVPPGRYTYEIDAPDVRPAAAPVWPALPKLRIQQLAASPAASQGGRTTLRYRLTAAAQVTGTLVDATGATVATLFAAPRRAGRQSFVLAADGLAEGRYRVVLAAASADGQQANAAVTVRVDRTLGSFELSPAVFAPRLGETVGFSFRLDERPARAVLRIRRGRSVVRTLLAANLDPGERSAAWDGRGPRGKRVARGAYKAELRVTSSIATVTRWLPLRVR